MRRIISNHLMLCLQVNWQTQCWFCRMAWDSIALCWLNTEMYDNIIWKKIWQRTLMGNNEQKIHWFTVAVCQIIKDRVYAHISRNKFMWNSLPGGLLVLPEYSIHLAHYPFYYLNLGKQKKGYKSCVKCPFLQITPYAFFLTIKDLTECCYISPECSSLYLAQSHLIKPEHYQLYLNIQCSYQ